MRSPAGFISASFDPLKTPNPPTSPSAVAGNGVATVSFTAPANEGGSAITAYYAVSNPGQITTSGASSPITATGLVNDTAYTFNVWALNSYGPGPFSTATGSVTPSATISGNIALFAGGNAATRLNVIQYVVITTTGNTQSFGSLTVPRYGLMAGSSSTRGVFAGGEDVSVIVNTIDYVTINTLGDATSFGALTLATGFSHGCSNSTRGLFAAGYNSGFSRVNNIDYVTIATTGNATSFGQVSNLVSGKAAVASTTRGVFGGGNESGGVETAPMLYVTIATTGNSTSFGNLTLARSNFAGACSSSTRGLFCGGWDGVVGRTNRIDYITIASTGNATTFGDLTDAARYGAGTSNATRGVISLSNTNAGTSSIDFVTIASTGNASFFGYLLQQGNVAPAACSNSHGGI